MNNDSSGDAKSYQVVALRYRPKHFDDLIGQSQVATALRNAIQQNRVGHAYLFTGARGVGKTSSARIFAKCLNCEKGPAIQPCGECDICQAVSIGEDVDVLEIDGASNRGIDEIRQLRANANVRPARARYKIYIIDEVHMLTVAAFNALLKTLEEPPEHVKFIFCTTDPEKIPITVLSRCQRFDFPPIKTASIVDRLRHIVDNETIEADDKALELLARRAGGSMRDSQSLLEQLLSYSDKRITVEEVHGLLGTADHESVFGIARAMVDNNASAALQAVHHAIETGVDAGQLASQLLGVFRDAMACLVGCGEELLLNCSVDDMPELQSIASSLGVEKVLAILQVLDQSLVKARQATSVRTTLETAVVRCCHLQNLDQIPQLIQQLQSAPSTVATTASRPPASPAAKKKQLSDDADHVAGRSRSSAGDSPTKPADASKPDTPTVKPDSPTVKPDSPRRVVAADTATEKPVASAIHLQPGNLETTWRNLLAEFNDLTAESAGNFDRIRMEGDRLVVTLKSSIDHQLCDRPAPKQRLESALESATGKKIRLDFEISDQPQSAARRPQHISRRQQIRNLEQNEFVRKAMEMFDGEIVDARMPPRGGSTK